MPVTEIPFSALPNAASLSGTEFVPIVQGGLNVKTTTSAISILGVGNITNNTILANISGSLNPAAANTLSAILDAILGSTRGSVIYRGASSWTVLLPGTSGFFLQTGGAGADPLWAAGGTGTITAITVGTGLAGGGGSGSVNVAFASVADGDILANI